MYFGTADAYLDNDGGICDSVFKPTCDPYIILRINGAAVFQTKTHESVNRAFFNETYTSPMPILKNSKIVIEMWDYDSSSPDDLMDHPWPITDPLTYTLPRWHLTGRYVVKPRGQERMQNFLAIKARWLR